MPHLKDSKKTLREIIDNINNLERTNIINNEIGYIDRTVEAYKARLRHRILQSYKSYSTIL